jgi:hypothetical protein
VITSAALSSIVIAVLRIQLVFFFFGWVIETYSPELVVKTEERLRPPSLPSKMSGLKGELARRVLRRRPFFVDARRIITAFTLAE